MAAGHPLRLTVLFVLLVAGSVLLWPPRRRTGRGGAVVPSGPRGPGGDGDPGDDGRGEGHGSGHGSGHALTADDVAATMVLLALALRSACGLVEAVESVAATSHGRCRRDLDAVAAAYRWGIEPARAWSAAGEGWAGVGQALAVSARAGVPPSTLLLDAAADLRAEEAAEVEAKGARVGVRMVLPLGLAFLPAFCLTSVVPLVVALAERVLRGG